MLGHATPKSPLKVEIQDEDGAVVWSFRDGLAATGYTSMSYLKDGTQERLIEALIAAIGEARGQLRRPLQVLNVVPNIRLAAGQVDDNVPIS